eukprot:3935528-Rhodomonas_salina.2
MVIGRHLSGWIPPHAVYRFSLPTANLTRPSVWRPARRLSNGQLTGDAHSVGPEVTEAEDALAV